MRTNQAGFTLAELLISLAILGVIATFTIPKIIGASGNGQNTAIAKEAASMVAGAMSTYQLNNTVAATTTAGAMTPFMNYVATDTATAPCTSALPCLKLHNGGFLQYGTGSAFGSGTTPTVAFNIDPDGPSGTVTAATFIQFQNGRLTTGQQAGTVTTSGTGPSVVGTDPSYIQNWN
jgi:prepilin-type N-terminal cleavage/methylation domain-containing protein